MKVFIIICVHAREKNTHAGVNVHIQVMLKVISFVILNMYELVETWLPEA